MLSKKSFFNPTLFRKNMSRSWPLWGGVSLVGALFPIYLLLAMLSNDYFSMERHEFVGFLYEASVYFLPAFTCGYAILVAMFVWSYLHNSRSVGMMHALAISRTELFVTNTLSGLAMLLVPYAVVGGMLCLVAGFCGSLDIGAVLLTIVSVLLETLLFFGMGTLCAMLTGSVIATAAYYAILNFAAVIVDAMVNLLAQAFIFGLSSEMSQLSIWLSPLVNLYENVEANVSYAEQTAEIVGFHWVVIYGVVGLAMLAVGWFLYQMRRSESAGDVVAFVWMRPVFRVGVALTSALTLGRLLYELLWGALFQTGHYADAVPMAVCSVLCAVLGYYAASMLLEKSLRVFKGSGRGVLFVSVLTAVLCLSVSLDVLGIGKKIPDVEKIERVELSGPVEFTCYASVTPQLLSEVMELHQTIIDDSAYAMGFERYTWTDTMGWTYLNMNYFLKDGSRLDRSYRIPVSLERIADETTYDGKLANISQHPEALAAFLNLPEDAALERIWISGRDGKTGEWREFMVESGNGDTQIVYDALRRDAAEGNFMIGNNLYSMWQKDGIPTNISGLVLPERFRHTPNLELEYHVSGRSYYYGRYMQLQPSMTHTLNALLATGVITQADIDCWMAE
ncbi:MAG: ABC transporter permease [Oscillospiraceae bacterium]|nr:ABC transporter permease [Oscillospiraceae bacterium]